MSGLVQLIRGRTRREQVLGAVSLVAALVLIVLIVVGGGDEVGVDTTLVEAAATSPGEGPVKLRPGMIESTTAVPPEVSAPPASAGVAPLALANGDKDADAVENDSSAASPLASLGTPEVGPVIEQESPRIDSPGIRQAAATIDRVSQAYRACFSKASDDPRGCFVILEDPELQVGDRFNTGGGFLLTVKSSDGHVLSYTWNGREECRKLDDGTRCDGWSS